MIALTKIMLVQKRLNEDVTDYDLLEDLIYYIDDNCPPGAILVFLPVRSYAILVSFFLWFLWFTFIFVLGMLQGVAEIYMLIEKLTGSYHFRGPSSEWILPLHSSLSSLEQRNVFLSPPCSKRKVTAHCKISSLHLDPPVISHSDHATSFYGWCLSSDIFYQCINMPRKWFKTYPCIHMFMPCYFASVQIQNLG